MRTFLKSLVGIGGVAMACLLLSPAAHAACADPTPTAHSLGTAFTGLPEAEFSGVVFVLPTPSINNGGALFFCKATGDPSANGDCSSIAGTGSDGRVMVNGDWSAPGVVPVGPGCPSTGSLGADPNVAFGTSIRDEGLESHTGLYVLSSVGFEYSQGWWLFDLAQIDGTGNLIDVGASTIPRPNVSSLVPPVPVAGALQVNLGWDSPVLRDDCTPQNPLGSCTDAPARAAALSGINIYKITSSCATPPTSSRVINWGAPIATLPASATSYSDNFTFDPASCYYYALGLSAGGHVGAVSGHSTVGSGDRDGDTIPDATDNCPDNANTDQANGDSDFPGDVCDNCPTTDNGGQEDGDGDGDGDVCDNCASVPNSDQANNDSDSLGDSCDNCDNATNENQSDTDTDGFGDACDNCADISNSNQADADTDNVGDVCDNCPSNANTNQADIDSDTFGDACDNCATDFNPDQSDVDDDDFGDICDTCPTIFNPTQDPAACVQAVTDLVMTNVGRAGQLSWKTTTETTIDYFNVIHIEKNKRVQANPTPIPCTACEDGRSGTYFFNVSRHQSATKWFVEIVNTDGSVQTFGPAAH